MSNDRTNTRGDAATSEPALTQKNSQTIIGEETLAGDGGSAVPSSYGAAGGTTDAYEEGAGQADADAGQAGADGAGI
jgi:hypothetical protein